MNNIARAIIEVPTGIIKAITNNILHGSHISPVCAVNPFAEITIDRGSKVSIGSHFRARGGSHTRVRKGASLNIGRNVSVNHGCMIVCRESIEIGNDVQFSPNVMVYDHDHDYRANGGVKSMKFKTSPIKIGDNVWIGANTVILRRTEIGDNCVIAAGSIIKGVYPDNSVIVQKRTTTEIRKGI